MSGGSARRLDSDTVHQAASDPVAYRGAREPHGATDGEAIIELPPHGLVTFDADLAAS
jgi:hypothetical protein